MRSFSSLVLAAVSALALAGCASSNNGRNAPQIAPRTAWIVGANGAPLGQATFTEAPHGVLIKLEFSPNSLPPGWHGLHLHQVGNCSDFAAGFQASGAHAGHGGRVQHGLLNPAGPEAGDLPNVFATPMAPFGAELFNPHVTLASEPVDGRTPLLDADGSALIVHAGPDDQLSQPIGGAGARIGCAALTQLP